MNFWRKGYKFDLHLLREDELLREIKNGRSLIRIGDGEINLMLGIRNHYQTYEFELKDSMLNIVRNYSLSSPYLLSIPKFVTVSNKSLREAGKFQVWMPLKVIFSLYFNKMVPYLDAHSFYYDGYFERTVGKAIESKNIVLITNQSTIEKQRNNLKLTWKNITYVPVPEQQSFDEVERIKKDIELVINTSSSYPILLFAMGPVGKMLAYEYSLKGIQCLDIGKTAEVMYTGESIAYMV